MSLPPAHDPQCSHNWVHLSPTKWNAAQRNAARPGMHAFTETFPEFTPGCEGCDFLIALRQKNETATTGLAAAARRSTHTDPQVKGTHQSYQEAMDDLVHLLHTLADDSPARLAAFDDDGHFDHHDHAAGIVNRILTDIPRACTLLMNRAHYADQAIVIARERQEAAR